ncbi:MAG: hypothetical protein WC243_00825 [Patescibacteria group bacterium]|jgi:hypothetical protein
MKRVMLALVLIVVLSSSGVVVAEEPAGTTLMAEFGEDTGLLWMAKSLIEWLLDISATPNFLILRRGEEQEVSFFLEVEHSTMLTTNHYLLTVEVCVVNTGAESTENLSIALGGDIGHEVLDLSEKPVLNPGEEYCYKFEKDLSFLPSSYYVQAQVAISNHADWLPGSENCPGMAVCPYGPTIAEVLLPPRFPTVRHFYTDASVSVEITCPEGFECISGQEWPVSVNWLEESSIPHTVLFKNDSAPSGQVYEIKARATVVSTAPEWPQLPVQRSADVFTLTAYSDWYRVLLPLIGNH